MAFGYCTGDFVQTMFDTGRGLEVLYGRIIASGNKTVSIRWESGIVNRIHRGHHLYREVQMAKDAPAAWDAIDRAEKLKGATP